MKRSLFLLAGLTLLPAMAQAKTEISWWHAMTGANAEVVDKIAGDFNASQSDYELKPVFKGTYPETLNAGIAALARLGNGRRKIAVLGAMLELGEERDRKSVV